MPRPNFDAAGFYEALDAQRQAQRLNWKQVAAASGISASTLTRLAQGRRPDVDSLAALLAWSGLNPADFVRHDLDVPTQRSEPHAGRRSCSRRVNQSDVRKVAKEVKRDVTHGIEAGLQVGGRPDRSGDPKRARSCACCLPGPMASRTPPRDSDCWAERSSRYGT